MWERLKERKRYSEAQHRPGLGSPKQFNQSSVRRENLNDEIHVVQKGIVNPNVTKTQAVYASAVAIRWYVRRVSLLFIKRSLIAPLGRTSTAARFRRTKRKV